MKTKKTVLILLLVAFPLFTTIQMFAQQKKQQRFTVMGLGDSITEGGDSFTCYIYPLWEKLMAAGYDFDFIGPRESKCRIGTLNCCGFGGRNVEFLDSKIDSLYRLYPADIVLLHAGHNHFIEENPVPGMIKAYKSIISKTQAINPNVYILVAQVIHSGKLPKYSYIPDLNRQIATMVKAYHSDHIILVNQAKDFDWKQMTIADKVHPNKLGGEQMASVWFKALKKVLAPAPYSFKPEIVPYKTLADGQKLTLHIFKPTTKSKSRHAAIVYFFGGSWQIGTPLQFYRECSYYASRGMVAISADYRIAYLHHSTVFESFEDAKDAMRWIRTNADKYGIDTARIAAAGASAGGHLAAALGTIAENNEKGVSYKPNLIILNYAVIDNGANGFGSREMKARFREISPIHNISKLTPPTLFLLGTKDVLIPITTGKAFQEKMTAAGIYCELHLFEGVGHPIFYYRKPLTKEFYKVRQLTDDFLFKYGYLK